MRRFLTFGLLSILSLLLFSCNDKQNTTPDPGTEPTPPETVPAFVIELGITSYYGIQFTFKPADQEMLYTNILFDESFLTEDGLTTEDIKDQILNVSNKALSTFGTLEKAIEAEFFYKGDFSGTGFEGKTPGSRYLFAVMGLEYDKATNTVRQASEVVLSDVFEVTNEIISVPEVPYVEMSDPEYLTYKGKDVVAVKLTPNSSAEGYVFGKAYPADYRETHSDYEIIQELTAISNMGETMILNSDLNLRAEMKPKDKMLFAVTSLDKESGKQSSKLNWMILEAPSSVGGKVRIVDSAAGIQEPEPEPDPSDGVKFDVDIKVNGKDITYTITPSDPNVYYFTYFRYISELTTPEEDAAAAKNLIDAFNGYMRTMYYTVDEYIQKQGNLFKGTCTATEPDWESGEYYLIYVAAEINVGDEKPYPTITATQLGDLGKTYFKID